MQTETLAKAKSAKEKVLKTYILLPHTKPTAPIYTQVSPSERVRMDKLPRTAAYLKSTFTDAEGNNKTIRLKLNQNTIWQEEQIKNGVPANEKFTAAERAAVTFHYEMLHTNNPIVQQYLETSPQFDKFEGDAPNGEQKLYRLYNRADEVKAENEAFKQRLKAANKIADLNLDSATELIDRIFGSTVTIPATLEECQNLLVSFMDDNEDGVGVILREEKTVDEEVGLLVSKLTRADLISFTAVPQQVSRKVGAEWVSLKSIPDTVLEGFAKEQFFIEFLMTEAGAGVLNDLRRIDKELEDDKGLGLK